VATTSSSFFKVGLVCQIDMDIGKRDPCVFKLSGHMQPSIAGERRKTAGKTGNAIFLGIDSSYFSFSANGLRNRLRWSNTVSALTLGFG
jgi:hypothetical protein